MSDRVGVLTVGAALGFGNGPLLLAADPDAPPPAALPSSPRVLCPGEGTTAALLYRVFHGAGEVRHVVFDRIMPALEAGEADYGVCIHEGRFTYAARGLHLVEDLGRRWESETGAPLPLGGLLARKDLPGEAVGALTDAVRASLRSSLDDPPAAMPVMRRFAAELDDDVIMKHVDLYVNAWTMALGAEGVRALRVLEALARRAGVIDREAPALAVLGD